MVALIDEHREEYGVEPICRMLPIAPSTYYQHKDWEAHPDRRSKRAKRDEELRRQIRRIWD
jgi:putative transposase